MNPLLTALLIVLASHLASSHVHATEYPYTYTTSPPPPYHYQSPPPPSYNYPSPPPPPYKYQSPPASPSSTSKPPPSPYVPKRLPPPFKAVVTGNVYCDICKNGKLKKPLKGVTVGVFCWNGKSEDAFYGTTDKKGAFKINLKGFDYVGCGGAKACAAKLISASYTTPCTQPTNVHRGQKGARLHVKAKAEHGVTLKAGPFAYIPTLNYPKCYHHPTLGPKHGTSPAPYKTYTSPAPPPPYKYESRRPPPQSPPSPPPCRPPPPSYKYTSPPPPPY